MSSAKDKNEQALKALFGSVELASRLTATRIAVVTAAEGLPAAGVLLGEVLVDMLARLWPNIDFVGSAAESQLATAREAATSGGATGQEMRARWAPPYDCIVAIGCDVPEAPSQVIRVGANSWVAELGSNADCGESSNPVGPAFAAALAGAQVFRRVFDAELRDMAAEPVTACKVDVRIVCDAPGIDVCDIDLGETHVFGVGAVTHGLMWLLEHWPADVSGQVHLADLDKYGQSNGQRYAFMRSHHAGLNKAVTMRDRLRTAHLGLLVEAHQVDLNTYCAQRGYDVLLRRVIAGLDSAEARRHAALKLPERTINMWTEGVRVGAGRYLPGRASACLACDYLEDAASLLDEVAQVSRQTGLRPDIVRDLLDHPRGLLTHEAGMVAGRWSVFPEVLVGKPLRSVLPMLCAMGRLQMPGRDEAVDVPFAFASLFAGIAGFMMLLKDLVGAAPSEGWNQHVFKVPTQLMRTSRHRRVECVSCGEFLLEPREESETFHAAS